MGVFASSNFLKMRRDTCAGRERRAPRSAPEEEDTMGNFGDGRRKLLEDELRGMETLRDESTRFAFVGIGAPPYRYNVTFRCKGLVGFVGDHPQFSDEHRAEITLHDDYPLSEDSFEIHWLTDILHPNIDREHGPCIKGTPLGGNITVAQICEFLAEMLQFMRYNVGNHWTSESSNLAVEWVNKNQGKLPLDSTPLRDRSLVKVERQKDHDSRRPA